MAAQALVRTSYDDPLGTFATNVMGTVHLLEALRQRADVEAVLVITTDKVYANDNSGRAFVEDDPLGGHDPYSASKAAAELATRSYASSFLKKAGVRVATARAGNVVGGGDWSADRLVPDVWRAAETGVPLKLRSPLATRPWQHVLDPLAGYFRYAEALANGLGVPTALNFGPPAGTTATVADVAERVGSALNLTTAWERDPGNHPHEMALLSLDPSLAEQQLGWRTKLSLDETIDWTASWYAAHRSGKPARDLCLEQIDRYEFMT
jgi:CDP-glucose 4,6-dehydratase